MERIFKHLQNCNGDYANELISLRASFLNYCNRHLTCEECQYNHKTTKQNNCYTLWLSKEVTDGKN